LIRLLSFLLLVESGSDGANKTRNGEEGYGLEHILFRDDFLRSNHKKNLHRKKKQADAEKNIAELLH